ncbi:MAG: hypothetical protein ACOYMN_02295 [Roseimicrobium sp.]
MQLLKRFELWILLAVITGGLTWVFLSQESDESDVTGDLSAAVTLDRQLPLKLHRCVLLRDYANARLDIDLRVLNDEDKKLVLQAPTVRLLTAQGREVPSFFLPFDPVPEVPPKSRQDVQLRYWLEKTDLEGALTLEVAGKAMPVKSAKPFALETVPNGVTKAFAAGSW